MTNLCCEVLKALKGKTLVTAESCTGGGIGAALTGIPGSSEVYKGGVICYTDWVKASILGVDEQLLCRYGAVSEPVAGQMALGVRMLMNADVAVSVTGLAGPGGDDFGNAVGTVYIGLCWGQNTVVQKFQFNGDREYVRSHAVEAALRMVLDVSK